MHKNDRRLVDRMEKHVQTLILTVLTGLIFWIGNTVSENRDGITRLTVIVEGIVKNQTNLSGSLENKVDKATLHEVLAENARQWEDIKLNNQSRQTIRFIERDLEDLQKEVEKHLNKEHKSRHE